MDFDRIKSSIELLDKINDMSRYVSKERFDLAAKVKYDIDDERRLDRLYGLFNQACKYPLGWTSPDLQDDLALAVNISEAAYHKGSVFKYLPTVTDDRTYDRRRYYYTVGGNDTIYEADINLLDSQNIILLAELIKRDDVQFQNVVEYLGELTTAHEREKKYPYYEGDIVFLYGDPTDRVFYDWYRSDAGVYLATADGWRKLQYIRGKGYLNKDSEPEYENENCYTNYKLEASGKSFRIVGNIHKDVSVLIDKDDN